MDYSFYGGFTARVKEQGLENTARFAQEKGFTSVEFFEVASQNWKTTATDVADAKRIKNILAEYGLTTSCYSLEAHFWGVGEDGEAERMLLKNAEYAAALGSEYFHHTLIGLLELPENAPSYKEALEKCVESAARVAKYAERLGLTCLYEEQGMYFNGAKGFGGFYREIKNRCRNVGVCGDLGNILFADENPEDFFAEFATEIRHVHLKDYLRKTELSDRDVPHEWYKTKGGARLKDCNLGDGIVDIEKCLQTVKAAGYNGALSFELARLEYIDDAIAYVNKLLR